MQIITSPQKIELDVKEVLVEDTSVSKEVALSQLKDQVPWQSNKAKVLEVGDTSMVPSPAKCSRRYF